jgi:YVTN family beta-propeller protein
VTKPAHHTAFRAGALSVAAVLCACALGLCISSVRSARASAVAGLTGERLDYASPIELLLSPDETRLYVLCQQSAEVRVLNSITYAELKKIAVGRAPRGFSLSSKGDRLYVANSWDDTISVIDTTALEVTATWPVSAEPSTVIEDRAGKHLFVANRISNDVAVLDPQTGAEEKRLAAGRGASYITPSPDGTKLYVTHVYPNSPPHNTGSEERTAPDSEITVIDTARAVVSDRISLPHIAHSFHIAFSPDGRLGVAATLHPKNLVPLAHLEHGGAFADTLTLFGADIGKSIEVPLDELERYSVRPFAIAITPDKSRIFVTSGGSEEVTLTGPSQLSVLRHGEQTFYTSKHSFQGQIGCANCHIDSTFDGLQWDLEPDGFGRDIVDNRPIEAVKDTEPYKWNGGNPNLPTECGPRTEKYFWRAENFDDLTLTDLVLYIRSLTPRPNRWRLPELTASQERGKALFERSNDKFGNPISEQNRCIFCHSGAKGTDQKSFDVGTKKTTDNSGLLDTPQLTNIAITGPYLHDGSAATLEQIWTVFNPEDKHGRTNDLTKDELNDLIDYLRTR